MIRRNHLPAQSINNVEERSDGVTYEDENKSQYARNIQFKFTILMVAFLFVCALINKLYTYRLYYTYNFIT